MCKLLPLLIGKADNQLVNSRYATPIPLHSQEANGRSIHSRAHDSTPCYPIPIGLAT